MRLLPDALDGWDADDASKLTPPAGPYALLAPVTARDGAAYRTAVTSLPDDGPRAPSRSPSSRPTPARTR